MHKYGPKNDRYAVASDGEVYKTLPKAFANKALTDLYLLRLFKWQQAEGYEHMLQDIHH